MRLSLHRRIEVSPPNLAPGEDATFHWSELSDDGALLVLGREGEVVVVDAERGAILRRTPLTNVFEGAFVPGGHSLELGFRVLDVHTGAVTERERPATQRRGGTGRVRVGELESGRITLVSAEGTTVIDAQADHVSRVRLFPDDSALIVSTNDVRLSVRAVPSGEERVVLAVPGWFSDFAASPDGKTIAVSYGALEARGLLLADSTTGAVLHGALGSDAEETPYATSVAFHPRQALLAVTRASHADAPMAAPPTRSWIELYELRGSD